MRYRFAEFELDTERLEFWANGEVRALEPQVFDVLLHLIGNADRVVSRDELIEAVWSGRIVSDATISARINAVRKAVGDSGARQDLIKTVPRRGFRFVAPVEAVVEPREEAPSPAGPANAPPADRPSIAVLPFDNMTGDPEQEFFSDGISEDIIAALSRFHWFFVIARNSSFVFKGQSVDVREVARQLGVRYVLEGSLRKSANRVRVTVQFIDAVTGNHIWADRYDRELEDVFAIQDDITQRICGALEGALSLEEQRRARLHHPGNLDAWTAYHLGLKCVSEAGSAANAVESGRVFADARSHFEHAYALDPNFARPMSAQALALRREVVQGVRSQADASAAIEQAIALCSRAIALDPQDGIHRATYGTLLGVRGDWTAALQSIDEGIELNPNSALAYFERGLVKSFGYWPDLAIDDLEIAARLSPLDAQLALRYPVGSWAQLRTGEYEGAATWGEKGVREVRSLYWPAIDTAVAYFAMERPQRAREFVQEAIRRKPDLSISFLHGNMTYLADNDFKAWFLDCLHKAGMPE
jgi:TolB-like protein